MADEQRIKEQILARRRQREKIRYQLIKNDPVKFAEWQEKERLKYLRKKEKGRVKPTSSMTADELNLARERSRKNVAAYRNRQRKLKSVIDNFVKENYLVDDIKEEDYHKISHQNRYITDYDYEFIPSQRGNKLLMWRKYTYIQDHKKLRYYCSKQQKGCKARLKLGVDGNIESATGEHWHLPPAYMRTATGLMVKMS
ncbi:Modifier of mdg4 [Operophtera brumata]|uniref:Modifier of mdg4 n=1 Tax=Operophtera brumata TaxID=104452 RepID=A0A0L7KWM8_OPEBR|nr:Modifier of mdg4 [Operophtera brumata]